MSRRRCNQDEWLRSANLTDEQQALVKRRSNRSRIALSICLIGAGVLLFLANLGLFPVESIWVFWPLFPIAKGIERLVTGRTAGARGVGLLLIFASILFLLFNLGWIHLRMHGDSWPIALILIGVGFVALFNVLDPSKRLNLSAPQFAWQGATADYENIVNDFVVLGSLKRKLETSDFRGGNLTTVFGNIEMDLRHAFITPAVRSAVINVTTVFGETKIRTPENWRITVSGAGILGNFEDKTIPPNTGPDAPTLIVTGFSLFGSTSIED